jgi:hypothetical protein
MMTLAAAKHDEFLNDLDIVDQRELMDPESSKWERIASRVDAALAGQPHIYRSGPRRPQPSTASAIGGGLPYINLLSSQSGSDYRRTMQGTGQRRRNKAVHIVMAEAIAASSEKLLEGLKEINATTREMEKNRVDTQFQIFLQDMLYRREHDLLHMEYKVDRDRQSLENTRLSLFNQGNIVHAIINLAEAIKALSTPTASTRDLHVGACSSPQTAERMTNAKPTSGCNAPGPDKVD